MPIPQSPNDFAVRNKREWQEAIAELFPTGVPTSHIWTDPRQIASAMNQMCSRQPLNHTLLPRGGGQDIRSVRLGREAGTLELIVERGAVYVCRPGRLYFEHFSNSGWNSFFLLECADLAPSGTYEGGSHEYEELLQLPTGEYLDRSIWDRGYLDHDEAGYEIPFPDGCRIVCRYSAGKFMMVAKKSYWNRAKGTYDGRHSTMTPAAIRTKIQEAVTIAHELEQQQAEQ